MTKKQKQMLNSYVNSNIRTIYEAYREPSNNKLKAYEYCKADMVAHNGFDFRITGVSSHYFSCAYRYIDTDGNTRLVYHTHANRYCFIIAQ